MLSDNPTPRSFGGPRYTPGQDAEILEARGAGFTFVEISELLGDGRYVAALGIRWHILMRRAVADAEALRAADQNRARRCLRCGAMFESSWAGNRRCGPCAGAVEAIGATLEPDDYYAL